MFPKDIRDAAKVINHTLSTRGQMIATAESCTGGLIAAALTDVPGSSSAVHGGFVTYANEAKEAMLGVPAELIERHGAVSAAVARAMAEGARRETGVDVAIAVTGIAGPGGGNDDKPVGLVHLACASEGGTAHREERFGDLGREGIRDATVRSAFEMVRACLGVS